MTSNPNSEPSRSLLERHTTLSTGFSSLSNRFSSASTETGESSTAVSKRNSLITSGFSDGVADEATGQKGSLDVEMPSKDSRGSHRSHRSRNSGGFLLSNAVFDQPVENAAEIQARQRHSTHESKGKAPLRSAEKKHTKRRPIVGASVGGSPLAAHVTSAGTESPEQSGLRGDSAADKTNGGDSATKAAATPLDVDSAQIVNLALNLSESRRNASRRVLSQPLPQLSGGLGESTVGGSLRQHLQQQRRVPRNISPKPDRTERASRLLSGQRISSPLQAAFDTHPDGQYQYHFSASTLARAEKAKSAIELMAQYRRLLQFVPPLKPQTLERLDTGSTAGTAPGSPTFSAASRSVSASAQARQLGRPYNPLQYIRNRKVRARNSKAIDGEAQGFGDVFRVMSWVDDVTKEAISADYQAADCLMLPAFSKIAEDAASPHTSPPSAGKTQTTSAKIRRPRIDWVTNPADMIADIFWLEQDDNKKLIEDHHGRLIFPQRTELRRPISRRSEESEPKMTPSPAVVKKETPEPNLRIDTKLPEFKSVKPDSDKAYDSPASRARQKLRDVRDATRIHHRNNGSINDRRFLRSRSRSDSDSSDSDMGRQRRRRSGTASSADRGRDILEKQMMEMLAKEAKQTEWVIPHDPQSQQIVDSAESRKPSQNGVLDRYKPSSSPSHSRSASLVKQDSRLKRDSLKRGSSGRASLEVPGGNPRRSLEFDSTAPNSPETKASKAEYAFVPSIAMDLSPPRSRNTSPSRRPLSKVRSKILPFYERTRDASRVRGEDEIHEILPGSKEPTPESPDTPEGRRRSQSPIKRVASRKTDDSSKLIRGAGSIRRGKGEDSGIRGLFKGSKNPVTRVSDFFWKKESTGISSGFSTDESDTEDLRSSQTKSEKKGSRESSAGTPLDEFDAIAARKEKPSFILDMPVFTSPFDRRGRSTRPKDDPGSPEPSMSQEKQAREERRKFSRAHLLELPPRIDVHSASPTSSPDLGAMDRSHRDSSVSDIESTRGSYSNGVHDADARLNAILGLRRNALPITGLSSLETSHDTRPSLDGKRQWSISDRGTSVNRGPMTKREIARVRALLLSSGIKAKEISRRAAAAKDIRTDEDSRYKDVALLAKEELKLVPKSQEHRLAAKIISEDIQLSSQMWHASAETFCNTTVSELLDKIETLRSRVGDTLTPLTRKAADEADEVSKDLVTSQTLQVKSISDTIAKMMRRRSRKFRWLRRGGWVMVEWALVGVMWWLWFMVVLVRVVMGVGRGAVAAVRWLFWL